jgi:hypothetical protein
MNKVLKHERIAVPLIDVSSMVDILVYFYSQATLMVRCAEKRIVYVRWNSEIPYHYLQAVLS